MKALNNLSRSVTILVTVAMREIDESKAGAKIRWYWSLGYASCEGWWGNAKRDGMQSSQNDAAV